MTTPTQNAPFAVLSVDHVFTDTEVLLL